MFIYTMGELTRCSHCHSLVIPMLSLRHSRSFKTQDAKAFHGVHCYAFCHFLSIFIHDQRETYVGWVQMHDDTDKKNFFVREDCRLDRLKTTTHLVPHKFFSGFLSLMMEFPDSTRQDLPHS